MARHYRCGVPKGQCEFARTEAVIPLGKWKCPSGNPACEMKRKAVPWLEALWCVHGRILLGAGAALVVLLILALCQRADPLMPEAARLREQVALLDSQVRTLEAGPSDPSSSANAGGLLKQLAARAADLEGRIGKNVEARQIDEAKACLQNLESLPEQARTAIQAARKPPSASGERTTKAKALMTDLQGAEDLGLSLLEAGNGRPKVTGEIQKSVDEIPPLRKRVQQLVPKTPVEPMSEGELAKLLSEINGSLDKARISIAKYVPPPVIPFPESEATLAITTTSDLAENLVLPMLKARSRGKGVTAPGQVWFYTSEAGYMPEERVVVRMVAGTPRKALLEKKADLVVTDHEATGEESRLFEAQFPGHSLKENSISEVIGFDALTLLAHPSADHLELTSREARDTEWIGGPAGSVEHSTALRLGFEIAKSAEQPAVAVLADRAFRGLGIYHIEKNNIRAVRLAYRAGANTPALKPSPFTMATGDYKFSIRIVASNAPSARPGTIEFVKFMTSPEGQKVVAGQGYVDRSLRGEEGPVDPRILAVLGQALGIKNVRGAIRLSTNFCFPVDEDRLEFQGQSDLERLPAQVAQQYPKGRVVILGFTDNTGPGDRNQTAAHNLELSIRRARRIADQLRPSLKQVAHTGLGDQLPVDTNDTEEGRSHNRRGEVWVVPE